MAARRRQRPLNFEGFFEYVGNGVFVAFAVLIIGGALALAVHSLCQWDNNHYASKRVAMEQIFYSYGSDAKDQSHAMLQQRRTVAKQFEAVDERSSRISGSSYLDLTDYQWNQIDQTARTGEPIHLDTHFWSVSGYAKIVYGWLGLLIMWCFLSVCCLVSYAVEADNEAMNRGQLFYFADLPWKKVWPFVFTIGAGPIFMVVMAGGALYMKLTSDPVRPVEPTPLPAVVEDDLPIAETPPQRRVQPVQEGYRSAPQAARTLYTELRVRKSAEQRQAAYNTVKDTIEEIKAKAQKYGEKLRRSQQRLNELRAEERRLAEAMETAEPAVNEQIAGEEFDRILQLPGVMATQVVNERIRLIVRASHHYRGETYDLGDWQMDFGSHQMLKAVCLRSGVRRDWTGGYPAYRIERNVFCFGDRHYLIEEHLAKGQYLEAMALAVECLNSVNKEHLTYIPSAFELLPEGV
ncbi:MAG TPA: hypothetical protein VG992_04510 [Candidatus Saccharimonadales bacterium]|nr:hypothetical protein [Candidatus Saccharimonadales bacterium]